MSASSGRLESLRGGARARARVLYDFSPSAEGEIAVNAGDVVCVVEKADDGWWDVKTKDGTVGVVPAAYCEEIEPLPSPSSPPPTLPTPDEAERELSRRHSALLRRKRTEESSGGVTSVSPAAFSPPRTPTDSPVALNVDPFLKPRREWYISSQAYAVYKNHFERLSGGSANVDGRVAARFLLRSKLPKHILARLLEIADMDGTCSFDRDLFAVAFHLTRCVSSFGMPVPASLPRFLVPKSRRDSTPS